MYPLLSLSRIDILFPHLWGVPGVGGVSRACTHGNSNSRQMLHVVGTPEHRNRMKGERPACFQAVQGSSNSSVLDLGPGQDVVHKDTVHKAWRIRARACLKGCVGLCKVYDSRDTVILVGSRDQLPCSSRVTLCST